MYKNQNTRNVNNLKTHEKRIDIMCIVSYTNIPFASVAEGVKLYNGIVAAERTLRADRQNDIAVMTCIPRG